MGLRGIFKFIFRRIFEIFIIGVLLVVIPNLPPYANVSKPFSVVPSKPLTGKLSINNRLQDVEIWHKGDFLGPEAFADFNGELYTGLMLGDVVKLTGEHITPVVKFGKPCKDIYEEAKCGRPLGLDFDKAGNLFVIDAYYGLFQVNVKTGDKKLLVGPNTKIEGREPKLFNSLTVASNGDVYWTDSSSDFILEDGIYSLLTDPTGRLFHYDSKTKKHRVLLDNIGFANGVALSDDEEFIVVAETGRKRLLRYYLKGAKKGKHDIFIDGLPGLPDNLKADGKGGFFVPLIVPIDDDHPALYLSTGPFPLLRKAIVRFMGVIQFGFKKLLDIYPNVICQRVVHYIGHFGSTNLFLPKHRVTLLRVDRNGQVTDSVHNTDNKIQSISEMHVLRDVLYLGSPFNDYIAKIPLDKLGWNDLKADRVQRSVPEAKPTTTTPRPTTTTPRPTTTTPKPTTTTPKPTTTTPKPTTTTPKPTTTTPRATTTTPKPTTTAPKPTTTSPKPTTAKPVPTTPKPAPTVAKPAPIPKTPPPTQKPVTAAPPAAKQQQPPPVKQDSSAQAKPTAAPKQQPLPTQAPPSQEKPRPTQSQQTVKN